MPDWSPEGLAAARAEMQALRASLEMTADGVAGLRDVASRDRALAAAFLDVQLAEDESIHFARGNPSLAAGEAIFGAISLMTRPFAAAGDRADAAASRLSGVPAFLAGARRSIAPAVPEAWRIRTLRECDGADRLLCDSVPRWIAVDAIDAARAATLLSAARQAREAFDEFRRWLTFEVKPAPADRYACGADLFDLLLTRGHWCTRSRSGLLADARAALDEAIARAGERASRIADGGWPEVRARLADAHPSADD